MKLKSLHLKNFRKFQEKIVSFEEGTNIIYGKNEQGKSTILIALLTVLYFDAKTKSSKVLDKISPWGGNVSPFIRLEYEQENRTYVLEKDFQGGIQSLVVKDSGDLISDDFTGIIREIKKHTGIGSEQVFILTALIAQNDIARVGNSKEKKPIKTLREAIDSSLLGGTKVETGELLKDISKEITDLDRGLTRPAKYPGKIKGLKDRLEELQEKSSEIRLTVERMSSSTKNQEGSEEELKKIEDELSSLEKLISNDKLRVKYEKRLKELDKLISETEKRIREVDRLESKLDLLKKEREEIKVDADVKKVQERLSEIKALIKDKEEEKKLLAINLNEEKEEILALQRRNKRLKRNSLMVLLVIVLLSFFLTSFNVIPLLVGGLIGIGIYTYFNQFSGEDLYSAQVSIEEKISSLEDNLILLQKEKNMLFDKLGVTSESELVSLNSRMDLLDSEISGYKSGLKALSGSSDLDELKDSQAEYLAEKKDIEQNKLTEEIQSSKIDPMKKFSLTRRLEELKRSREELKEANLKARVEKENSKYNIEDLNGVEEEIFEVRKQLDYYKRKSKILKLVQENIEKARVAVLEQSGSIIADYAKQYLPKLTEGKYSRVKITPDFEFEVYSEEKEGWLIPDDYLSQGTIDQIYFVIRLAILSVICKEAHPPLVIDDAFVTFDSLRLEGVRFVLNEIAERYQVIMLTCHNDYNSWGNLIRL